MSDPSQNRRESDSRALNIEAMIAEENDPKQRAFLIVMNNINVSLVTNTSTIREISEKLDTHLTNFEAHTATEEALMNKGRGMWKILAWVLGAAQAIVIGLSLQVKADLFSLHNEVETGKITDARIELRILSLEKTK